MDSAGYTALARQSGLMREMQAVAHNIANLSTTGFRREGLIFAEHVSALEPGEPSLSIASAHARTTDLSQGPLTQTGGAFDLAVEGDGFFLIGTPEGERLTRAGSFTPGPDGLLAAPDGALLLDAGGAPVFVPPDARAVAIAADGTLSADGRPLTQIGLYLPTDPAEMSRQAGVRFAAPGGIEPVDGGAILQGFLEQANVDPVGEVARMIEVQRAYELGQKILDREDERIRAVVRTLGS